LATILSTQTSLSFEPNEWRQTQALNVPTAGLMRVNLHVATLDLARPTLEDFACRSNWKPASLPARSHQL